jgi:uncharacterized protein (TIGR02145 family)
MLLMATSVSYFAKAQIRDSIIDKRNGQLYHTVKIGKQWWMCENLNYETPNSFCYNKDTGNCHTYGRLYTYESAQDACPTGWHLPSHEEWTDLSDYLGGEDVAGTKMSGGTRGNQTMNSSLFTGLPGGDRNAKGSFVQLGSYGAWWSSTEYSKELGWCRFLYWTNTTFYTHYDKKTCAFSVRCVKDTPPPKKKN